MQLQQLAQQLVSPAGMVLSISLGFADLVNKDAKKDEQKKYALFIGDTIQINEVRPASPAARDLLTSDESQKFNLGIVFCCRKRLLRYSRL